MDKPIIIQIHPTPEIVSLLKELMKSPGVTFGHEYKDPDESLTLHQAAKEVQVTYHTLREWVVIKKIIPFSRIGGSPKGDIRVMRRHVRELLAGKGQKNKRGRKGREVTLI